MSKKTLATVWLDGCSGCHMSFLDLDERLVGILDKADLVYSPLVDIKKFPDMVDIALIEGAVSSNEDQEKVRNIRRHTRCLVSLGDCAVNSNVPGMRNYFKVEELFNRGYFENATRNPRVPDVGLPQLLKRACPVHEVVQVDFFIPGCPPSADAIHFVLNELLDDRIPDISQLTRFGA
ncbi:MAG: NADP oxidoreductase [Candidatus Omnitrophica bacterium]|nr:MAG: NAD-reducing hydrogenase HoxS subunit delta [Candidatus Hinthialibacteria bacterium OLB16]MBE7489317.1 NADP oxidoreductase [bacterium]MCC6733125.1 NADP oxidoreductase [Candidatus Omnitrophota bacterium]MCE7907441.1 NADP oxidoreductase [Candidatus Omnitrophica bacterium COP1]MBV6483535.1 NAD-reducing hydrogenase HoxS subunit delta [bacterium]